MRRDRFLFLFRVLWMGSLLCAASSLAEEAPTAEQATFFESKVRPLLAEKCLGCHGVEKQKSGLRLDSRSALLAGGDSGPAIEPGNPESSLLVQAIKYESLQMPPDRRLSAEEVDILTRWVQEGAPWPNAEGDPTAPVLRKKGREITEEDRRYWAFQPIRRPPLPSSFPSSDGGNPIDAFLQAKLAEKGLTFSPPADPRTRLRRLAFDLTGLPPEVEVVEAFMAESSPDAYDRIVDQYLASPTYGERWGRHWLDLVRFAQTNGYERDAEKPNAWRYRDYVIASFNGDKPYDQFLREQLAGDELDQVTDETIIATGFYRLGVWDDEPDDARQAEFDELDDMLTTTGNVFLGLTLGCARCHDHKFDPMTQEDYYSLLAFLRNIQRYVKPDDKAVGAILANLQNGGQALAVFERGNSPPPVHVLARGNAATPGVEVSPRFPLIFGSDAKDVTPPLPPPSPEARSLGRRRALAEWLTHPQHPLTARVIVNRLWHYHFGKGLVPTPSDFGRTGLPCSHPELLDYLASELRDSGWSLKHLHRLIVTSAAYQQSSRADRSEALEVDPGNTLLWRQNLRRLEAEAIRDAMLAVSGDLNLEMGGRGIFPPLPEEVLSTQSLPGSGWEKSSPADQHRRSVYIFVKRTLGVPMLEAFDAPSPDTSQSSRATTTIAPQALILLNSSFTEEQAEAFARQLLALPPEERIEAAFRRALARSPTERERNFAREFLDRQQQFESEQSSEPSLLAEALWSGWTPFGGRWSPLEPEGCSVDPDPGAKLICNDVDFSDGEVECQVCVVGEEGDAGLLLRVTDSREGTDSLKAYHVNVTPTRIRLGKHVNNWKELVSTPRNFPPESWVSLRVQFEGNRLRVFVNGSDQPSLEYVDPEPLTPGKVGVRTYQARASFRGIKVRQGESERALPLAARRTASPVDDPVELRTWSAFCKILLNLNEFIYVD